MRYSDYKRGSALFSRRGTTEMIYPTKNILGECTRLGEMICITMYVMGTTESKVHDAVDLPRLIVIK
jgi:hypothetical protein